MADPNGPSGEAPTRAGDPGPEPAAELERLRELLLGKERQDLGELRQRLDSWKLTPEEVAEQLPEAIGLRTSQDGSLGRALAPTLEAGINESVQRNPQQIAQAIYPILGPAIRRAISETLSGFVDTLNRAIEHSLSWRGLKWRLEALRTGVPYAEIVIKHALVYRVEEVFLIQGESGLPLGHVALDDARTEDPDLISGMLTAIQDFVADTFETTRTGGLSRFKVGELTVRVESGPRATLAAVVRGQEPPELVSRMQAVLETVHFQFRGPLAEFDGDTAPLEPALPLLAELLETVVATDRSRAGSLAPRIAWWLLAAGLVFLAILGVRAHLAWRDAVEALRSEPGLTLIEADRGLWTWRFEGLRDPLARDPIEVLAAVGADTERVEARWERYLSLDREMVLARADRDLEPPTGATLTFDGDTLHVGGTASARWVRETISRRGTLPGVARLDIAGLEIVVPGDLTAREAEIEAERLLFDVGSARLRPEAVVRLDSLAPRIRRLQEDAEALGYETELRLVGRTDSSGTEEGNRTLSEERTRSVLDALVERGLTPDRIEVMGIGVRDPLDIGGDEAERQRINRSVSFAVTFSGWDAAAGDSR